MVEKSAAEVILRRLRPEDIPVVAAFEREIAEISFPDDPVTDLAFYERKLSQAVNDRKSEPLVGELGGRIVAWAWIGTRENFVTHERYGEVRSFYVVADFRGSGYALALMRACIDYAKEHGLARLTGRTHAANEAMQAVYGMFGFEAKHIVYERLIESPQEARSVHDRIKPHRRHQSGDEKLFRRKPRNRKP